MSAGERQGEARQHAAVSREYQPDPDRCARAVELLLRPVSRKAADAQGEASEPRLERHSFARRGPAKPG
jgi:hypothetical protein